MANKTTTALAGARGIKRPQVFVTATPTPTTGQVWPRGDQKQGS